MAAYYCDLDQGTYADATGADHAGNEYTGPAGFQAAIRGTGNATALAAGDELYIQAGTGDASRLVLIDCNGTSVINWGLNDRVQDDDNAGGSWTGRVVETNTLGFLGADDLALVWLDAGLDEDDIILAEGVDNLDAGGGAGDPVEVDPLAAKSTPGIQNDNNAGDVITGHIRIIGVDAAWAVADPDAGDSLNYQAVVDGGGKAANGFTTAGAYDRFWVENITFQNMASSGMAFSVGISNFWRIKHCLLQNNGAYGLDAGTQLRYSLIDRSILRGNTSGGARRCPIGTIFAWCDISGNSGAGIHEIYSPTAVYNCLIYENAGDGLGTFSGDGYFILGNVFDGNGDGGVASGILLTAGENFAVVLANRITNNTDHGIEQTDAATEESNFEDYNVFDSNANGDLQTIAGGFRSYGDHANHIADPADDGYDAAGDHYEVTAGKEYSAQNAADECVLNWDGVPAANNAVWITAGLPVEAAGGAGGGAVGRGFNRGVA